jgi:hypothetical protein
MAGITFNHEEIAKKLLSVGMFLSLVFFKGRIL